MGRRALRPARRTQPATRNRTSWAFSLLGSARVPGQLWSLAPKNLSAAAVFEFYPSLGCGCGRLCLAAEDVHWYWCWPRVCLGQYLRSPGGRTVALAPLAFLAIYPSKLLKLPCIPNGTWSWVKELAPLAFLVALQNTLILQAFLAIWRFLAAPVAGCVWRLSTYLPGRVLGAASLPQLRTKL